MTVTPVQEPASTSAQEDIAWYALTAEQTCERMGVDPESGLQRIFDTVALTSTQWGVCLLGPIVYLVFAEAGKLFDRRQGRPEPVPVAAEA